ncbi:hypothetical protein EV207_1582 [Scopulibacillus darangshiensis]|uniref:Uncharacterized protein n=1 Tax=Scopulibacillus darangshiensis TaxID=442528 RepID=A0A4R2NF82_9BACL|nr:hypothetical protein [Scopulibacillus darangshiensis]TCP19744.1 hypothetical protein EV207_1582 [Scopulibacillus darangshiensis]
MKTRKLLLSIHLLVSIVLTLFELYFIVTVVIKYSRTAISPYTMGMITGFLTLVLTYLISYKTVKSIYSTIPAIIILLSTMAVLYLGFMHIALWEGTGYFFISVFALPYVVLSLVWSGLIAAVQKN